MSGWGGIAGHAFLSYAHSDADHADRLQRLLEVAGIRVWRDTDDLWPGDDWQVRIRRAITNNALVFIACFSRASVERVSSHQNEELVLAVEQFRLRKLGGAWLIPVRFDECEIPDWDLGAGRTLASIQHVDLFGEHYYEHATRLIAAVLRILDAAAEAEAAPRAAAPTPTTAIGPSAEPRGAEKSPAGRIARLSRVADCDAISLGVHRAIAVGRRAPGLPGADLPLFVMRAHDLVLRAELDVAAASSGFIMLVGGSSTGKTRSAVEAVRDRLPDWLLAHPFSARNLTSLIENDHIGPRTVLWLNESQIYLEGGDLGHAAELLGGLLARVRPLVVIGTLWPEYWLSYIKPPQFGAPDPYRQSRQLLDTAIKIDIPDRFSEQDIEVAWKLAARDPRLAIALATHRNQSVIQVLAGGPALIDRWQNAPTPYGRAVITAAIDARRLGHLDVLSPDLIQGAASAYLDGPELATATPGWFDDAIAYACEPVKGAIAPLTATSHAVGHVEGYLLADYLDQHGRAERRPSPVPDGAWHALAVHASQPGDLNRLGNSAADRGRYKIACLLWSAAGDLGDTSMVRSLRGLLARAGHRTQALAVLERAVEAGNSEGLPLLAELQRRGHRHHQLEPTLRRAAAAGHFQAGHDLAVLLYRCGRHDEAMETLRRAVEAGDKGARVLMATLLSRSGRDDESEQILREAAAAGDPAAVRALVARLDHSGRSADAEPMLRHAVALGLPNALRELVSRLLAARRQTEAEQILRDNETRIAGAPELLVDLLRRSGREQEAARVLMRAEARGGPLAPLGSSSAPPRGRSPHKYRHSGGEARHAANARKDQDPKPRPQPEPANQTQSSAPWKSRRADPERFIRHQIESGDPDATRQLAVFLTQTGRLAEGERILRREIVAGDSISLGLLTMTLRLAGRLAEASLLDAFGLTEDGSTASQW